jgi:hypothetical protein
MVQFTTATAMDEHNKPTTTEDLINMLLSEGLGEGLPKVAEIILNAAMRSDGK